MDEAEDLRGQGRWLVEHRRLMEQGESGWLLALARFDMEAGWVDDGQTSVVDWLQWRTGMARSTAYEKAHLAHELQRHPVVAEAFTAGRLSYSAARLICRLRELEPETERALVTLAEHATIRDLEAACGRYRMLEDQERPPGDPDAHRSVRLRPDIDGWVKVEHRMPAIEGAEFVASLDAFAAAERREHQAERKRQSARAEDGAGVTPVPPEDSDLSARAADSGAAASDSPVRPEDQEPSDSARAQDSAAVWRTNRALAFRNLLRCAMAHLDDGQALADDRFLVHVVARDGRLTLLDGTPVDPSTSDEILCGAAVVAHTVDEHGEPMSLGRKTRIWSTGQRRAVLVRDGGRCRFPGCGRRVRDIHHRHPWEAGGSTDVTNGMAVCRRHHTLLHHGGFRVRGEAGGDLVFSRPDGTELGATSPAQQRLVAA